MSVIKVEGKGIKGLVGRKLSKTVKFMGEDVKIFKLSISEVNEIRQLAIQAETDEDKHYDILRKVIRLGVEDAESLSDEDFDDFSIDELSKLSNNIMQFSGLVEGK